ncbi:hypothetical protein MRX96_000081 [Rhipicephalus microplus]
MELDTWASVSVMAGKAFKRTFPGVPVEASGVMLCSYSKQLAQVEGQAQVSVHLGDREATLPLYLTKGPSPTMLGRNWIQALGLWLPEYQEAVRAVEDVPSLLTKFKALFQPGAWPPAPRKVEAVLKAPKPQNKRELQSYLGLIDFYRTFLLNLSSHLQPLHLLLRDGQQWAWRKEQDLAFQRSKELITKAPLLVHFDPAKPVVLTVDASLYGVGAVLAHREKTGQERLISFASRRLHAAEQRYSHLDKEGLALTFGVERFHQYLAGVTSSGALGFVARGLQRLVYRPGKDLAPADALSRLPLPEVPAAVPEPAEVFMLEHAYPEVLYRSAVSQATSRDPVLSLVVKAVSRGGGFG